MGFTFKGRKSASVYLLFPAVWNSDLMVGAEAAISDHET